MKRIPIIPTIVVAAAVLTMIALGIWQLQRKGEKEALIARYERVQTLSSAVPFPRTEAEVENALYRASSLTCERVLDQRTTSGRGPNGEAGLAQIARCALAGGGEAEVALGLSQTPEPIGWQGGEVIGFVGAAGKAARLIASPPVAGLAPMAHPDPKDLPNNHLAYAGQWFFFALTALVIYILALRRRRRGENTA